KADAHNLSLLRRLRTLTATGLPVLVGTSRKGFLGRLVGGVATDDRLEASVATAVHAMLNGASMVRAHDVKATVQAARLVGAMGTVGAA
ncbi:MAG TPA: dihydropteroate synthase, partial [Acidimicrobiales bacterium]